MPDSSPPYPTMACGTEVIIMCSVGPLEGGLDIVALHVVYSTGNAVVRRGRRSEEESEVQ